MEKIDSALHYIGQKITTWDSVYSTKVLPHLTFVNVGGNYPDQKLSLVFYKKDLYLLKIKPEKMFGGKKICVSGKVIRYDIKPQIVVRSLSQIELNK